MHGTCSGDSEWNEDEHSPREDRVIHISRQMEDFDISMVDQRINQVTQYTYLGVEVNTQNIKDTEITVISGGIITTSTSCTLS